MSAADSPTPTTTNPAPTLVTDGQVITIADSTGRLLTCGFGGVAVCIAEPISVEKEPSKTQWRVQLLKNGFFKLQSLHDGSLLMAERCYKDPYLLKPGTAGRGVARVFQEHPQIADTSALTTTLEFAKNPCGLPRGSGAPLDGISDPAGFEKAMQAAQTMWAYTSDGKMVCAYDYIWFGFYNKTGVVSEVAMRADTMVSTADLETATPKQATLRFMVSNMWLPVVGALRTLTSVALPGEGGLTPAVYFGNMPPRSLEHATAAMEGSLCTTWKLNDVPSEQVFVGGLFCPLISSSFAPEAVHGIGNRRGAYHQVPAYMIKVQTTLKPDAAQTTGSTITYGVKLADVLQSFPQTLVCNGVMHTVVPGTVIEVESEFTTRELNVSYISTGLAACPLAISYLALDGVRLESNDALTFVLDPSDAHSPKLSQLSGEDLLSMNPNANKDDCHNAAAAIKALHAAVANPMVGRPTGMAGQPGAAPAGPLVMSTENISIGQLIDGITHPDHYLKDGLTQAGELFKDNVIDPVISGAKDAANQLASIATSEAWEVIHMAEQGAQVAVDTAKVFVDDVMNGVKVLVKIGGDIAHFVAQGVQDVVAFARLVWQQLEITVEKMEEFLKMWLDFEDFKVTRDCLGNFYTDIKDNIFLNRAFMIDPLRDFLEGQVHNLESKIDSAFDDMEKCLGVTEGMTAKDPNSITMKAFNLAYSALTWLLDKIMRLLPSGGALMDLAGVDKVLQDTFGSVFDKYKSAPDICDVFSEVIDDLTSAFTDLATGNVKEGLGQVLKSLHTVVKGAFGVIEYGIDIMADLLYYGIQAIFKILDLTTDLGAVGLGALSAIMSVFGVDIPSFSVMDLALWPQAITLTLLLKASGMDIWNSFKASNGHLLQGLGNTIFPSGASNSNAAISEAPTVVRSANNSLSRAPAPRATESTTSNMVLTAGTMHASATEAGAAKPVTIMSGAQPISSGQNVDSQPIITTRVILDIVAAAIDLGYGIYFYSDTNNLSMGLWSEGGAMWAGAICKISSTAVIMVEQYFKYGLHDSRPIIAYSGLVIVGVCLKLVIRVGAVPTERAAARRLALAVTTTFEAVGMMTYLIVSNEGGFDGEMFGMQVTGLAYSTIQVLVARLVTHPGGIRSLPPLARTAIGVSEVVITGVKLGLDITQAVLAKSS